jgi:hypothetical protein
MSRAECVQCGAQTQRQSSSFGANCGDLATATVFTSPTYRVVPISSFVAPELPSSWMETFGTVASTWTRGLRRCADHFVERAKIIGFSGS